MKALAVTTILLVGIISTLAYRRRNQFSEGGLATQPSHGLPSFRYIYRYVQVSTFVASLGSCLTTWPIFLTIARPDWIIVVGVVTALASLILFLMAIWALGDCYSPCYASRLPDALVSGGPYRWIRHPIYTANVGILTGLFAVTGSAAVGLNAVLLVSCYLIAASREEAALLAHQPGYASYVRRTGRFLPRIFGGHVDVHH
jgi:protein-S-isoprenylcysteine O-methyltransferase Ste14